MKILLIILIFFNLSCSFNSKINNKSSQLKDKDNSYYFKSPSIDDFLSKINKYTEVSEYPNLEN